MYTDCKGIAERFAIILGELSSRERVNIRDLEDLTGYDRRNLQMDLNQRLKSPFAIETDRRGNYWMDKKYQGLFSVTDIKEFSKILGASEIFPELDISFLKDLINSRTSKGFIIKSPYRDSLRENSQFSPIIKAINKSQKIKFTYKKSKGVKRYLVEPYRLVNSYGSWYLFAVDKGLLKTFRLNKISGVTESFDSFIMNKDTLLDIENSDTVWLKSGNKKTVILKVLPSFVSYFEESVLLPGEKSRNLEDDGSLIVVLEASVYEEIKSIIKYWIPRIEVIEPLELKTIIKEELTSYLLKS